MKAILISIKPEWVAKILNGDKTIEIRKTMPKCDLPIDVYIYCTKGKYEMGKFNSDKKYHEIRDDRSYAGGWLRGLPDETVNGKVVAKFTLNKVERIHIKYGVGWNTNTIKDVLTIEEKTCLSRFALFDYLGSKGGYAIHISDLEIFDRPLELNKFKRWCDGNFDPWKNKCLDCKAYRCDILANEYWCDKSRKYLTKAPQNFMYIEVE